MGRRHGGGHAGDFRLRRWRQRRRSRRLRRTPRRHAAGRRADRERSRALPDAVDLRSHRRVDRARSQRRLFRVDRRAVRPAGEPAPRLRAGELRPGHLRGELQLAAGQLLAAGAGRAGPVATARQVRAVADPRGVGRERNDRQPRRQPRELRGPARRARLRQLPPAARGGGHAPGDGDLPLAPAGTGKATRSPAACPTRTSRAR